MGRGDSCFEPSLRTPDAAEGDLDMRMIARAVFAALIVGLLPQAGALAADYGGRYGYPPPPVEIGSGWYLRGDIGGRFAMAPSMTDTGGPTALTAPSGAFGASISAGYGYQFSDAFRGELAIDYGTPLGLTGTLVCDTTDSCVHTMNASTASLMANFYMDFANNSGFMPYVGAGVGVSMVTTAPTSVNVTEGDPAVSYAGATQYNLAWALMAGVGWDISPNTVLDLGFRLASLGGGVTGAVPTAGGGDDTNPISISNIIVPEVRLGMRYKIN